MVLFLPGRGQTKDEFATLPQTIPEQGAIVFVIDYPDDLSFSQAFRDNGRGYRGMAETVACAIRFARARASDYGMDTPPGVVTGFSLGGGDA